MSNLPGAQECEDYKLKVEEIGRYLASIRPIVGRKVTASYRRKLGLIRVSFMGRNSST